jgi:hypothetical protein
LHIACHSDVVTNLDFLEVLLEAGADPNTKNSEGLTPLMITISNSPSAAKFLLSWPTTAVHIANRSERTSFLSRVRFQISLSSRIGIPDNPTIRDEFLLQQWRVIEEMLVERGSHDTCTTSVKQGYGSGANAWSSDRKNNAWSSNMKKQVIFGGLAIFFVLLIEGYRKSSSVRS